MAGPLSETSLKERQESQSLAKCPDFNKSSGTGALRRIIMDTPAPRRGQNSTPLTQGNIPCSTCPIRSSTRRAPASVRTISDGVWPSNIGLGVATHRRARSTSPSNKATALLNTLEPGESSPCSHAKVIIDCIASSSTRRHVRPSSTNLSNTPALPDSSNPIYPSLRRTALRRFDFDKFRVVHRPLQEVQRQWSRSGRDRGRLTYRTGDENAHIPSPRPHPANSGRARIPPPPQRRHPNLLPIPSRPPAHKHRQSSEKGR